MYGKIFEYFHKSGLKDQLRNCYHYNDSINDYHLEDDCWSHSLLVSKQLEDDVNLFLAGLFHDIGKIKSRFVENGKAKFHGHEGISFYMANDHLRKLEDIIEIDRKTILKLCLGHSTFRENPKRLDNESVEFIEKLKRFAKADYNGRFHIDNNEKEIAKIDNYEKQNCDKKQNYDKNLFVFVGVPNSGKSTLTKFYKKKYKNCFIVSRDEILENYGVEKYGKLSYNELWKKLNEKDHKTIDEILESVMRESKNHKNVMVDMTNTSLKRQRYLARYYNNYNKTLVILNPGFEEIFYRNKRRNGKEIPEYVIINMMKNLKFPETYLWDKIEWIID